MEPENILQLVETGYDELTERFQTPFVDNFGTKPVEREVLDLFAELCRDRPVCDIGCGVGAVTRYLSERGLDICGIDLSTKAIARARELNPGITFTPMNFLELQFPDRSFGGLTAFFSIVHLPSEQLSDALNEFSRVLDAGGVLLLSCYRGEGERFLEPEQGHAVRLFSSYYTVETISAAIESVGFEILEVRERDSLQYEIESGRVYVLAKR